MADKTDGAALRFEAALMADDEMDAECHIPPLGWRCTRGAGHDGPCAAVECPEDVELVRRGMERLRESPNVQGKGRE